MSLMKTLAKVAIGVAVAKGASSMMGGGSSQQANNNAGLGGLLGGLTGGGNAAGGAGLQDMLGGLLGGAQSGAASGASGLAGGLGGLLENLGGGQQNAGAQGGLSDMLGGLAGMAGGAAGAGGLMGALSGALSGSTQAPAQSNASFGQVLNSAFDANPEPEIQPSADQEAAAGLMLSAMIQAAKSDGNFDAQEQEKLVGQLGDEIDPQERAFVQEQMQAPVDVQALAAQVPAGMGPQVYAMSLLAIDLDSQAEAQYLHQLAQALNLDAQTVNGVHSQLGAPSLYT